MAKPDFLCIGAQKSGTTWLDKMFRSHPYIWTPPVKELQFFNELYMGESFKWTRSHRETHAAKAMLNSLENRKNDWEIIDLLYHIARKKVSHDWYQEIFNYAPKNSRKGEMTPEYSLLSEGHVKDIKEQYPDTKILFVVREPVSRAMSGIKMRLLQNGYTDESPQEEIDNFVLSCADDWDVIERGNYCRILNEWKELFGEENFLLLFSEDLRNKSQESLEKISAFLNLDYKLFRADPNTKVHVGRSYQVSEEIVEVVRKNQSNNVIFYDNLVKEFSAHDGN